MDESRYLSSPEPTEVERATPLTLTTRPANGSISPNSHATDIETEAEPDPTERPSGDKDAEDQHKDGSYTSRYVSTSNLSNLKLPFYLHLLH